MKKAISEILENEEKIVKITASSPADKSVEFAKITVRPLSLKKGDFYQVERYKNNQVFHLNIEKSELASTLGMLFSSYCQVCVFYAGETATYYVNKLLKAKKSTVKNTLNKVLSGNDRQKEYIINEGDEIPVMIDLGVFNKDFGIIKSKYDKFKQINRFVEIIDDELKNFQGEEITVLDFGCGKSYLTFILLSATILSTSKN